MFDKLINKLASSTQQTKQILEEVAEFEALKSEIDQMRCVIEFDGQGNITRVNQNAVNSLHYSSSELVGQHHRTLVSRVESSSTEYQNFWTQLSVGKAPEAGVLEFQNKSGESVWFQGYYAPVMGADNTLRKVVAYLSDITDQKANMHNLQGFDQAIKQSFGYVECDPMGRIFDCNELFHKPLGYEKSEVVGKKIHSLLLPEDANNPAYVKLWEDLANGEVQTRQTRRPSKTGEEFWFQVNYAPVRNRDGVLEKIAIYSVCITAEKLKNADYEGQLKAIGKLQGVIEFDLKGNILAVNDNFSKVTGYVKEDIVGNHHSMFVDAATKASSEYKAFWERLARGEPDEGVYKRIGKSGNEIWLQASYNPIYGLDGKPFKVVKYATDITAYKLADANNEGQIEALNKVLGVIEFDLKGNILKANDNFSTVTGYSISEIEGSHHSMFVSPEMKASNEYKNFWADLARGEASTGQYQRFAKGGREIWLQASYNPIFDLNGNPFKVVKFATDITEQHNAKESLEKAVEETQKVIESAKLGDLTHRVNLEGKIGAIGSLCAGVNAVMDKLTDVVSQVREASETINTASTEIASGNNDLSSRTEQQASSLEETASSMEELSSTVKQNAENAQQANQLAGAASGVAVKGGEVVGDVVTTMSAINDSARKIEDIISVIDGIAFQTNILALNAAVEAARAGEQGRGFAVVAGEVRNLAQRSASAAKEIKELITDSVSKTAEGTTQVETAGATMREIVTSVQRVTDIMGEITAASQEQSSGIDQVNSAITSMDEVTQQNAALVEEAAAAAESLVDQASALMGTVSDFKLNGDTGDRREQSSPMRKASLRKPAVKEAKTTPPATVVTRTGTDDASGEWEEF